MDDQTSFTAKSWSPDLQEKGVFIETLHGKSMARALMILLEGLLLTLN